MEQQPPVPPVEWAPPEPEQPRRADEPVGALHNNRSPSTFTLGDALTTGFGVVTKPTFIVPVLILGVIVNAFVELVAGPLLKTTLTPGTEPTAAQVGALFQGVAVSIVVGMIGGILINLYGQIWAVQATSGPFPTIDRIVELIGRRWIGVIGTGIVIALIGIGLIVATLIVSGLAFAIVGNLGVLVLVALVVVDAWVGARLSMAGWLAADGLAVMDAINGSWQITKNNLLRIIGWGLAYGIVYAIVGGILGAILSFVPVLGGGVTEAVTTALGYGAGVTLYRRTQAAARPPAQTEQPAPAVA
jgi:hypothetical protein